MKKFLLTTATLVALATPAMAQKIDDATLQTAAMLKVYQQQCSGEIKQEYKQSISFALLNAPNEKATRTMATVNSGVAAVGKNEFCRRMETDFAKFITDADPFKHSSEMDVIIAAGFALMQAHMKCGGYVAPAQVAALQAQQAERGSQIAKMAETFKGATCAQTAIAYRQFLEQAARQ
jgi:hypothetical protein